MMYYDINYIKYSNVKLVYERQKRVAKGQSNFKGEKQFQRGKQRIICKLTFWLQNKWF